MKQNTRTDWFKRILLLAILLLLALPSLGVQVQGGDCQACPVATAPIYLEAYVRDTATGETARISVHRETAFIVEDGNGRHGWVTYCAEIPARMLSRGSTTTSRTDPSISYRLTLTQYFSDFYDNNLWWVSVSRYRGTWQSLDPQVTGIDGWLMAGAMGPKWGGGWIYDVDETHLTPGDSATRTLYPSWAGIYVGVDNGYQCGQIGVELRRVSGHTWEFWFNVCKGEIWPY